MPIKATKLHKYVLAGLATISVALVGCAKPETAETEAKVAAGGSSDGGAVVLDTDIAMASYTVAYGMSDDLRTRMATDFDNAAFIAGVQDALRKVPPRVSREDGERTMRAMGEKAQAAAREQAEATMATGVAYLDENGKKEGVTVLPSGLQYEVLNAGEGANPAATDTVTTHYEGRLIDGTVFDSSIERGEPASFPLNRVIPGWTEALQLMQPGAKWRLYIPPKLAYGERATGKIPANSTLIFDVELLSIDGQG